jgi:hypothetical protein
VAKFADELFWRDLLGQEVDGQRTDPKPERDLEETSYDCTS